MAQEFFIKSAGLEQKVREILPSQGGLGAGFDLSASTQIVPIVDLTESAEGSNVRADLQSAISFKSSTSFFTTNTTDTIISNTGTFRVFGNAFIGDASVNAVARLQLFDASGTSKTVYIARGKTSSSSTAYALAFDFLVKLEAGELLKANSGNALCVIEGVTRQIAALDGTLIDP